MTSLSTFITIIKKAAGYEQNQVNFSAKGQMTQATLGVNQISFQTG